MRLFVINVSEERKKLLSKHFDELGVSKKFDVTWSGEYKNTHPFVTWLKLTYAKHMSVNSISNHLNWFNSLEKGTTIGDDEETFAIACDDVVFPRNWEESLSKVNLKLPANNISEGICFHIPYDNGYTISGNFGGMECIIFQKNFAKFVIGNIDFRQCLDIVIGAMMMFHGYELAITPICHQTSILTDTSSTGASEYSIDWKEYSVTYRPSGLSFDRLKQEFEQFMVKKSFVEQMFFDRYATRLDIWSIGYIDTKWSSLRK